MHITNTKLNRHIKSTQKRTYNSKIYSKILKTLVSTVCLYELITSLYKTLTL